MYPRFFPGQLRPTDLADALQAVFDQANLRTEIPGGGDHLVVQIGTRPGAASGGQTVLAVTIQSTPTLFWFNSAKSNGWGRQLAWVGRPSNLERIHNACSPDSMILLKTSKSSSWGKKSGR